MSNTANTRLYKAPVNMTIKVPHAGELSVVVRRNVYFRRSDKTPYIVVKGRRKDVKRIPQGFHEKNYGSVTGTPRYEFVEVLQRSR